MAAVEEYIYQAVDGSGALSSGKLEAGSREAAVTALRGRGLMPLEVSVISKTGLNTEIKIPGMERSVKIDSLAIFAKQLAGLLNAGLPLLRSLTVLAEQTKDKKLKVALEHVRVAVEQGRTFSSALSDHPRVFPPLLVSLVRVGEAGGFLSQSMSGAAEMYKIEAERNNKIKAAMTYPIIVLCIALLGSLGMIAFIVPIFAGMFDSMGSELPAPTQLLVTLSDNMIWIMPLLAILIVAGVFWWQANKHNDSVRSRVDPLKLKVPVFGKLTTKVAVARFSRSLSMMLKAGVPLMQALDIVGEASGNWQIEQAIKAVQKSVSEGKSFSAPLVEAGIFPTIVTQMVSVGEESGSLPEMLESIAEFYDDEVKTATEQLTSSIEPILIVGIGIIIGGMVVALYLPIFSIYGEMGG